jgi:hypothetical protein
VEGEAPVEFGDLAAARQEALARALAEAVAIALRRHVPSVAREERRDLLSATFLRRPTAFLLRYSVLFEEADNTVVRVRIEAEVAWEKLLAELRSREVPVSVLDARPRLLLVGLGDGESLLAVEAVSRVLEGQGFRTRTLPGDAESQADATVAAAWARDLGCHLAVGITTGRVESGAEEQGRGSAAPPGEGTDSRVITVAAGWIVDARSATEIGRVEARGWGRAETPEQALAQASTRAGRSLGHLLLAAIEQSGWRPGEIVREVDLRVEGIPDPLLLEEIQQEVRSAPEVVRADLRDVGPRTATWRVAAYDSGLAWDAVVGAFRLPRGRLERTGQSLPLDGDLPTIRAVWSER